jgi:hypothetical protein
VDGVTDRADQADGTAWADKFDSSGPNVARIYDYLLGGKDHFAADRQAAQRLIAALPNAAAVARANRAFLAAAVRPCRRRACWPAWDESGPESARPPRPGPSTRS